MYFMDGFSGYNQIKMYPNDEKHIVFRTPLGIYYFLVMTFGLKNAGSMYQCVMDKIFCNLSHKTVECHVDDIMVKNRLKGDHLTDLKEVFEFM